MEVSPKSIVVFLLIFIARIVRSSRQIPVDVLDKVHGFAGTTLKLPTRVLNEYLRPNLLTKGQAKGWILQNVDLLDIDDLCRLTRLLFLRNDEELQDAILIKTETKLQENLPSPRPLNVTLGDFNVVKKLFREFSKVFEMTEKLHTTNYSLSYIELFSNEFVRFLKENMHRFAEYTTLRYYSKVAHLLNNFLWTTDRQLVDGLTGQYGLRTSALQATEDLIVRKMVQATGSIYKSTPFFICGVFLHLFPQTVKDKQQNKDYQRLFESFFNKWQVLRLMGDEEKRIVNTVAEIAGIEAVDSSIKYPMHSTGNAAGNDGDLMYQILEWYQMTSFYKPKVLDAYNVYYAAIIRKELEIRPPNTKNVCEIVLFLTRLVYSCSTHVRQTILPYVNEALQQVNELRKEYTIRCSRLLNCYKVNKGRDPYFSDDHDPLETLWVMERHY